MELNHYFNPVQKNLLFKKPGYWGNKIIVDFKQALAPGVKLALFSVDESRNAQKGPYKSAAIEIRKWFYQLSEISKIQVADLGELKPGKTINDTYVALKDAVGFLVSKNIIPIIVGGSQDLNHFVVQALENIISWPQQVICDAKFDVSDDADFHNHSYLNQLLNNPESKVKTSIIGYQTYFVTKNQANFLMKQNVDLYRLGAIRNQFTEIEPIVRDADSFSFDLSSIRHPDCPNTSFISPNGFYAEEACQLVNLAGLSDKLKCLGIYEYHQNISDSGQTAHLLAQLIWHFILGVAQRKGDYPEKPLEAYKKIFVRIEKLNFDLIFYKNEQNKRFWMELPTGDNQTKVIACSENDYKQICNNEIPDRIWKNISYSMK